WATVWSRNFTDEELKVRIATDPHAPAHFRAIRAPSNLPAFAAAFQCTPGSALVREGESQVVIWEPRSTLCQKVLVHTGYHSVLVVSANMYQIMGFVCNAV